MKKANVSLDCVACGVCADTCPMGAIIIDRGMRAVVDVKTCVGCGKCAAACPAGVIPIEEIMSNENP